MSDSDRRHNRIDYIEFSVTDMKVAMDFYGKIFQWEFNSYGPHYTGIKSESGEAGGFSLEDKVKTGGPLVVVFSNEIERTLSDIKNFGGKITKEIFEFPGGKRFEFNDPFGNHLAVWTQN